MAVFSVDSDAVLSTTTAVRGTVDRLQGEVHAMFLEQHAVIKLRITPEVEE